MDSGGSAFSTFPDSIGKYQRGEVFLHMPQKVLVVIGGGAAGFFCAINAALQAPGLEVILLEKSGKLLSKVRISGGGRCNLTHNCFAIPQLIKKYPRGEKFLNKAFRHFSPADTVEWFSSRGVALKTEADGRMFPVSDDSATIINCLLRAADEARVKIYLNQDVQAIRQLNGKWLVETGNRECQADFLCVATGGFPKLSMFQWIAAIGHRVEPPVPSLFTFNLHPHPMKSLMGVAIPDVQVKIRGSRLVERGPVLITHWGLSGPAVLRLSAWGARELAEKNWQFEIQVNWLPEFHETSLRDFFLQYRIDKATQKIQNKNPFQLPQRFWDYLLLQSEIDPETRWTDLPAKSQHKLVQVCCSQILVIMGKTTYKEEFVTAGGIKLAEVDPDTMMSRLAPGLFFAGEILDVDGVTGGFNFQHAWTSGFIAASSIAEMASKAA